jgi:hypothetical protein
VQPAVALHLLEQHVKRLLREKRICQRLPPFSLKGG